MANIELQMNAARFLAVQRNALRQLRLCPPVLPAVAGVQIVIDRIEIGANALRHDQHSEYAVFYEHLGEKLPTPNRCTGYQTQIAQDIIVHLTTLSEILSKPNQAPSVVVPYTATLILDLDFYVLDNTCYLRAGLSRLEPGPLPFLPPAFSPHTSLPQHIHDEIVDHLKAHIRPFATVPVEIGKISSGTKILNAGISVDQQLTRIALRAQIGGSHTALDVPWSNFFKGYFPDRLQGRDWGLFVEAGLLTETVKALVYTNLPANDDLQAFPGCTYSNAAGRAVLTLDVLLIYHLYRNRDIDVDINVQAHPKVAIELSVNTPNWLTVDFDFAHLLDSDDPLIALARALLQLLGVPVESILLSLAGSAAMAGLQEGPFELCKQLSPTHIQCDQRVRVPRPPGSVQTALTDVLALDGGITAAGSMSVRELTPAICDTMAHEFKVHAPSITCGPASLALVAAFREDPSRFAVLHAQAFLTNRGTAPVHLCEPPIVLKGADGPFPPSGIRTDSQEAPIQLRVDIAAPAPAYYQAPYPLDLLVRTSGGTRLIRFNAPPETSGDHDRMVAELLARIGNCQQLMDPFFGGGGRYNPRWSPRPPEGAVVRHLWQVSVSGLRRGEAVGLIDAERRELVRGIASRRPLRLSTLVAPGRANDLSIVRGAGGVGPPAGPSGQERGERGLEVAQTLMVHLGSVLLPGNARDLIVATLFGVPCVVAVLDETLAAYDVRHRERPVLLASWHVEGVRGALAWRQGLLAFGRSGLDFVVPGLTPKAETCDASPVNDAATDGRKLFVLREDSLDVYSPRLCRLRSVSVKNDRSLAFVGGRLLIGGRKGLDVFDGVEPERLDGRGCLEDVRVALVRSTFVEGGGAFVVVDEEGVARLLRIEADDEDVEEIARYREAPWFLSAVRLGDAQVTIGADRRSLDIYRAAESVVS